MLQLVKIRGQEHVAEVDTNEGATVEENLDVEADANDNIQAPGGDTLHPSDDTETANIDEQDSWVLEFWLSLILEQGEILAIAEEIS